MRKRKGVPSYPDFVKTVRRRGKLYDYFDTGRKKPGGQRIYEPLPERSADNYGGRYSALLGARMKREMEGVRDVVSIRQASDAYQHSKRFLDRSDGTQNTYRIYLRQIEDLFGAAPVNDITPADINAMMAKMEDRPSAANMALLVLRNVMRFALSKNWIAADPTTSIAMHKGDDEDYEPWPDELVEAGVKDETFGPAIALLYYTGQRIGDVCKMRWSDIQDDGTIHVRQQKTGKDVWPPIHDDLKVWLDRMPRDGETMLTGKNNGPRRPATLRVQLQRWASERGHSVVPHGLRKNAVNSLLEYGCTVAEVSAITGQSLRIVEHYGKGRATRRIGHQAMKKWSGTKTVD